MTLPTITNQFDQVLDNIDAGNLTTLQRELFAGQVLVATVEEVIREWVTANPQHTEAGDDIVNRLNVLFFDKLSHTTECVQEDFDAVATVKEESGFNNFAQRTFYHADDIWAAVNTIHSLIGENDATDQIVADYFGFDYLPADEIDIESFNEGQAAFDAALVANGYTA